MFGYTRFAYLGGYEYFPSWQPEEWNSACVVASAPLSRFKVIINGETTVEISNYTGLYSQLGGGKNLVLMNDGGYWGGEPMHGAVTDVNVWPRELSQSELEDWAECRGAAQGRSVAWEQANLVVKLLRVSTINISLACNSGEQSSFFTAFNTRITFQETIKFCGKIGGKIGVARDQETLSSMIRSFNETCDPAGLFYTGHTDMETEGRWEEVTTGNSLEGQVWAPGYPKQWTIWDCSYYSFNSQSFKDRTCTHLRCPICEIQSKLPNLMLRGVCRHSEVDTHFKMKTSQHFVGFIQTSMIFSDKLNRWEIVKISESNNVVAYMMTPSGINYPIGLNHWMFLDSNCTDPEQPFRSLSFHLEVEQPGNFCCDDGACIDSDLVFNFVYDCEDQSDEKNLTYIRIPKSYNPFWPPITTVRGGKIDRLEIRTTFTVLDVFDINEEESYFDLDFILHMKWYDKDLRFEYLKNSIDENTLYQSSLEKIWYPTVYFEKPQKIIEDLYKKVFVSKESQASLFGSMEHVHVSEIYFGKKNAFNLQIRRRALFSCSYDKIRFYPFGKQDCYVKFYLFGAANNMTRIVTEPVVNKGALDIGRYLIQSWKIHTETDENVVTEKNKVIVTMHLGRDSKKFNFIIERFHSFCFESLETLPL